MPATVWSSSVAGVLHLDEGADGEGGVALVLRQLDLEALLLQLGTGAGAARNGSSSRSRAGRAAQARA